MKPWSQLEKVQFLNLLGTKIFRQLILYNLTKKYLETVYPPEDKNYVGVKPKGSIEGITSLLDIMVQSKEEYKKSIRNLIKRDDYIKNLLEKKQKRLNKRDSHSGKNNMVFQKSINCILERSTSCASFLKR